MKRYNPVKIRSMALGDEQVKICVPLVAKTLADIEEQLKTICSGPFDLVEWRVDHFEDSADEAAVNEALCVIRKALGDAPLLVTFRTKPEGGEKEITLEDYRALCLQAASSGCADLIDVEYHLGEEFLQTLIPQLQEKGVVVIGSCHDFFKTPAQEEITEILCAMQKLGVDVTKMAVMPNEKKDVLTLLAASVEMEENLADRPFITMSMGKVGSISRIASAFTGAALTFAAAGRVSAPGQMGAEKVREALNLLS